MTYVLKSIEELAEQLRRGPTRLRLKQLLGIEFLLSVVESSKPYPFDFVVHAITGFRPRQTNGREAALLDGEELVADLVQLAEDLSDNADLSADALREPALTVQELADRFDVSTKTIFRWRRRGLTGWKFRSADRRVRVLFPERCVRRFVSQHAELVSRGSNFSQLTNTERDAIITRAKTLVAEGARTVNAVARVISTEQARAVETIRLILRSYDEAHPKSGIFNRSKLAVAGDDHRLAIWEAHVEGASLAALAVRFNLSQSAIYAILTHMRARDLKARKIEFVPSGEFDARDAAATVLGAIRGLSAGLAPPPRQIPAELPPYLRQLFRVPLLDRESEAALFRAMNFLKYQASAQRDALDPETATAAQLDEVERLLDEAAALKNRIVQANLRLVVSIAKKHLSSGQDLFELISDGNISLMRAVEKFDYSRGFKFSTYASWAVMKNFARSIPEQRRQRDRFQTGHEDSLETIVSAGFSDPDRNQDAALRGVIDRMLGSLDEREQSILRLRFGLEESTEPATLEQIGRRLGVSKERIRQLETRAIERLRTEFADDAKKLLGA